jgi:hypothetical protein
MTDSTAKTGRYAKKAPTRGGFRPGAGAKKAVTTNAIRELANRIARGSKVTPLEVILKAMYMAYDKKDWGKAAGYAKDAAPYIHPRLQAVELTGNEGANAFRPPPIIKVVINKP